MQDENTSGKAQAEFRRARARLGALALHAKRPEIAREAGRKGGEATMSRSPYGRQGWGLYMAFRRWHRPASNDRSRAPKTGSGCYEGGASEPDPVTVPAKQPSRARPKTQKNSGNHDLRVGRKGLQHTKLICTAR